MQKLRHSSCVGIGMFPYHRHYTFVSDRLCSCEVSRRKSCTPLDCPEVEPPSKTQQRRLRRCSSCCAVGKVCTLPIIIDSLDSITRLLRHWVCSLQSATVLSQRLPLVTFIWRDVMPDASRGSLNLFRKNLMPVGLASIATSRLLNQCSASSPRQHSKCNSKCSQLKKWMNDPEFQFGALFCLFNFKVSDWGSRANHGSVYPAVSLHGILFRRLMSELSGKLATFSDVSCAMCYPCRQRGLAGRP